MNYFQQIHLNIMHIFCFDRQNNFFKKNSSLITLTRNAIIFNELQRDELLCQLITL